MGKASVPVTGAVSLAKETTMSTLTLTDEPTPAQFSLTPIAVDTETAAKLLGISPSTVRAHTRRGDLLPRYVGTKPIFPVEELRTFVEMLPSGPRRL